MKKKVSFCFETSKTTLGSKVQSPRSPGRSAYAPKQYSLQCLRRNQNLNRANLAKEEAAAARRQAQMEQARVTVQNKQIFSLKRSRSTLSLSESTLEALASEGEDTDSSEFSDDLVKEQAIAYAPNFSLANKVQSANPFVKKEWVNYG
eukprot:snap_masked-scaffold_12-processed-gene-12.26-mRNA-1 protein AED:1.00 eAED:1.00 QI:0/-1/0/0/-1/1/1/0/147